MGAAGRVALGLAALSAVAWLALLAADAYKRREFGYDMYWDLWDVLADVGTLFEA